MAKKKTETRKNSSIEKTMLENFVEIQKVMVDLSVKLGDLSSKISRLLDLFETTAKTLSMRGMGEENKEISKKMDSLLEQNKTIAKGVSMMYENVGEQPKPVQRTYQQQRPQNFPQDRFRQSQK
ncbi:MAG: hypothetical protein Q7S06_03535 [Nanoarchaeota archaeon]|nr:hypothetical protein [Nanoarchaeota archaeon]